MLFVLIMNFDIKNINNFSDRKIKNLIALLINMKNTIIKIKE
jgi:hypothetical protein